MPPVLSPTSFGAPAADITLRLNQPLNAAGGFTAMFFAGEFASPLVVLAITGGMISALPAALGIVAGVQLLVALACIRLRGRRSAFPAAVATDADR